MLRSIKSAQRKLRVIALRIEGSTGTPTLEGLDENQCTIVDTGTGHYTITFNQAFAAAPHAFGNAEAVDKAVTLTTTASTCVVKVNDIDETPALSDGDVQLLIIGSDITDRY
tara:strand:+ start:242 stop:577 length:336 start_codon:yes stop_codon:yes gene_type:complete